MCFLTSPQTSLQLAHPHITAENTQPSGNPRTEVSPQRADLSAQFKGEVFLPLQSRAAAATPQHVIAPYAPGLAASASPEG